MVNEAVVVRDTEALAAAAPKLDAAMIQFRVNTIRQLVRDVMKDKVHYGTIPGTPKPCLYQPGAEILGLTFALSVRCETLEETVTEEEVSYRVRATAFSNTGAELGSREAFCSTREKKYRWRRPVHLKEFEAAPEYRRRISFDKDGNEIRQVRTDAGDLVETILGMASKRAHVAVIRQVTGCSDMFSTEKSDEVDPEPEPIKSPGRTSEAAPMTPIGDVAKVPDQSSRPAGVKVTAAKKIKSSETNGKPWTLYKVQTEGGGSFVTFSDSVYKTLLKAQAEDRGVILTTDPPSSPGKDPQIVECVLA